VINKTKRLALRKFKTPPTFNQCVFWASALIKGGVGKSTLAYHLGEFLNELFPEAVLAVNFDDQKDIDDTLLHCDETEEEQAWIDPNIYITNLDLFETRLNENGEQQPSRLVEGKQLYQNSRGLYVIPTKSFKEVEQFEIESLSGPLINLRFLAAKYDLDHVIIDSKPGAGMATNAALFVADYVFSPCEIHDYSVGGLRRLCKEMTTINRNRADFNLEPARLIGVLFNKVMKVNARAAFDNDKSTIRQMLNGSVLDSEIRSLNPIAESTSLGLPVWDMVKGGSPIANITMKNALIELIERAVEFEQDNHDPYADLVQELAEEAEEEVTL